MKNLPIYCIIVIGNPLTYLGHNLVWDRVRLLKQYDSLTFDYNASGIRTRKGTTTYELDGTTILSETGSGYTLRYLYGLDGLVGFKFGDNNYYYEKNLQGDITGIYDSQGTLVGSYSYDAWGKCSITYDTAYGLAFLNPFRYRGYYYDRETSLYYLNSRYYDPNTGRFINADSVLGANKDFAKYNLFAYCGNNSINRIDVMGKAWWHWAIGGALSFGVAGFGTNALKGFLENFLLTGEKLWDQALDDFMMSLINSFGAWFNGAKLSSIIDGETVPA